LIRIFLNVDIRIFWYYKNILVILSSIFFFMVILKINIKNKLINKIASITLAIYLIHDAELIRNSIYKFLHVLNFTNSPFFLIHLVLSVVLIFILCGIIEAIRKHFFELQELKLAKKFESTLLNTFNKLVPK
ncbi:MAG: hypothetical protein ACRCYE_06875, partial [Sarcina sp.]